MVSIVITGRGGAGKTTMSANLSTYFSRRGYRSLVVDGDLYLPKLAFHFGIYNPQYNIHTLLKNPNMRVVQAVYHDPRTGVDILPGSPKLYDVINLDQKRLREIVREIGTRYRVTIIDSPVGIPFDTISTFRLAQYQLIIVEIERCPIHSVHRMIENEVVKLKSLGDAYGLKVGVILNKVRESSQSVDDIIDFLEYSVDVPVVGVIPFDHRVPEATNYGRPVIDYAPHAKASRAIAESGDILNEWIFGREKKEGMLQRLYEAIISFLHSGRVPAGKKL
ncbi:septum site-determining protein MinD [Thermococcus celericrescens]|uniref:Septum site-determining protein MinD n=1 Tax=Thermococcus celericrescens TaxID=227598 RepID=A0A100XVT6_9EURY|nr:MinD/ParA family protein [Thermococcus celericrescens]KUH31933.1 septum site-determining protein MinD [Thermococcus celericrescens]